MLYLPIVRSRWLDIGQFNFCNFVEEQADKRDGIECI